MAVLDRHGISPCTDLGVTKMNPVHELIKSPDFRKEARAFAKWYGLERKAAFEVGEIASRWLEHYSRTRNAERLADALHMVTRLRVTGRTIMHYRDIYELDKSWHTEAIERLVHALSENQKPGLGGPADTRYTSPPSGPSLMDETAMAMVLGISNRTLAKYRRQGRFPNCWIRNAGRIMWKVSETQESWTRGIA